MKRVVVLVSLLLILTCVTAIAVSAAEPFPAQTSAEKTAARPGPAGPPPHVYAGYITPAPIRHTWPGGYLVMFHEVFNTLIEHMLGQY